MLSQGVLCAISKLCRMWCGSLESCLGSRLTCGAGIALTWHIDAGCIWTEARSTIEEVIRHACFSLAFACLLFYGTPVCLDTPVDLHAQPLASVLVARVLLCFVVPVVALGVCFYVFLFFLLNCLLRVHGSYKNHIDLRGGQH